MTNINLLKSVMARAGDIVFVECLAKILNISRATASKKLNGKADFLQSEISIIAERYNLTADEIKKIFVGE